MTAVTLREVRNGLAALLTRVDEALSAEDAAAVAQQPEPIPAAPGPSPLAWGAKVSPVFRDRVRWIAEDLDIGPEPGKPEPSWPMAWMSWETGRTFSASVKNAAGSGATGLIQFMPKTAIALGTTVERLAAMTAEDQLRWVHAYFKPYKGRLRSLSDGYMAILWPAAIGKSEDYPLFTAGIAYRQNAGLDLNHDGSVTKAEAAAKVAVILAEGLRPENVA